MTELVDVTEENFAAQVAARNVLTVVDFWAPWCGPCRALAPVLEQVAAECAGRVRVVKVNADEHPKLGMQFGVRGLPTLLFFRAGVAVDRIAGSAPKARIDQVIARHA
ncbi:MAG: thioredoxin [Gemmatimonadales bacterium]